MSTSGSPWPRSKTSPEGRLRPSALSDGGHSAYYEGLARALRERRRAPPLVLELDLLDRNVDTVVAGTVDRNYRIVAKSLPSAPLLDYIMELAGTNRLMVFHQPRGWYASLLVRSVLRGRCAA